MSDNTASKFFSKFATTIADLSATFVFAVTFVIVWAISGLFSATLRIGSS